MATRGKQKKSTTRDLAELFGLSDLDGVNFWVDDHPFEKIGTTQRASKEESLRDALLRLMTSVLRWTRRR